MTVDYYDLGTVSAQSLNDRLQRLDIRYRPGWDIRFLGPSLLVTFDVEDTYHHGQMRRISHRTGVPYNVDEWSDDPFVDWIYHTLMNIERHEGSEWFTVGGVRIRDPHQGEDR